MDGSRLSPFPSYSWPRLAVRMTPRERPWHLTSHGAASSLHLNLGHPYSVSLLTAGQCSRWHVATGDMLLLPATDRRQTLCFDCPSGCHFSSLLIPRHHLGRTALTDGTSAHDASLRSLRTDDRTLRSAMLRLLAATDGPHDATDTVDAGTGRRIVVRLVALCGGVMPDTPEHSLAFDRGTVAYLVATIDRNLRFAPRLDDLARVVGMSSSHFGKKFRLTVGLSLQRFVNRRRIIHAMDALVGNSASLSAVALDYGFASQSHFTRIFSLLTGMTPARFRRELATASHTVGTPRGEGGSPVVRQDPSARPPPRIAAGVIDGPGRPVSSSIENEQVP